MLTPKTILYIYQLNEVSFGSFVKQQTQTFKISAADTVHALAAILENPSGLGSDHQDDEKPLDSSSLSSSSPSTSWQ